jgi:hypothetical protein
MRISTGLVILSLCALSAAPALIRGQSAVGSPASSLKLEPVKQLRKGVDAWPLIANPTTSAEQRINATLTRLNERMEQSLRECDQSARDAFKELGNDAPKDQDPTADDWERSIRVTMTGPQYVSMVATDETDCGGAHPNSDTLAMVFDLTSGKPVNWIALISKAANATPYSDSIADGTKVGSVVFPALLAVSTKKATVDCKEAFEESQSYQLWPDAKSGTLIAEPFGLPHVVAACAEDLSLTIDQARKMGFDEALLRAIEQAHRDWIAASHSGKN